MIAEGLEHGTTSPPTRADIIRWCRFAMNDLPKQMVRNAWRHAEYLWFPPPAPVADVVHNDDNNNKSDHEDNDNESSSDHLLSSSDNEDETAPPLPSTCDFAVALERNANQESSDNDSQSTTLST